MSNIRAKAIREESLLEFIRNVQADVAAQNKPADIAMAFIVNQITLFCSGVRGVELHDSAISLIEGEVNLLGGYGAGCPAEWESAS